MQIKYPAALKPGSVIGVTAPSTGIAPDLEERLQFCIQRTRAAGFDVRLGECLRSGNVVSASAAARASELTAMLADDRIEAIVPPWGGELLINILPHLDFAALAQMKPKWIVGYSDMSTLLLPFTTLTGIATLHGGNFMEAAMNVPPAHKHWLEAITLSAGDLFTQRAAEKYQVKATRYQEMPPATEFNYAEPIKWKLLGSEADQSASASVTGRLIGGCLEVVSMLTGSIYGDIERFAREYAPDGLLLYIENCEDHAFNVCRMLHNLKLAGWFKNANGILIGRTLAPNSRNFTQYEALVDVLGDSNIPVIYDMDFGHAPPQALLVNGALSIVRCGPDQNVIEQKLC